MNSLVYAGDGKPLGQVMLTVEVGDVLDVTEQVGALVDPWNRNFVRPRWMLPASGVTGAVKARTGPQPWRDLARAGILPLGAAVVTDAGEWAGVDHLIHVAGLHCWWRASARSVYASMTSALAAASDLALSRVAVPAIGSGSGGLDVVTSIEQIRRAVQDYPRSPEGTDLQCRLVTRP